MAMTRDWTDLFSTDIISQSEGKQVEVLNDTSDEGQLTQEEDKEQE